MRKHRKWLMGFGIGIILGASMLQLIQFARTQDHALMVADGTKTYTQQQLDEEVAKAVEEARQLPPAPSSSDGGGESALKPGGGASAKPEKEPSPSPSASSKPASGGDNEQVVAFYVNNGMDLKTVARSLQKLGVIEDAADFTEEARSISRKMEIGVATFNGHPTYEEIIAELTRPKD